MKTLRKGQRGIWVKRMQETLTELGYALGRIDGIFGPATEKAVMQFQKDNGLDNDGIVGRKTHSELALELSLVEERPEDTAIDAGGQHFLCPPSVVIRICHDSSSTNISESWPLIYTSLQRFELDYRDMILMSIATVYVETGRFAPIDEYVSRYNTSPNGHPFDKYDDRNALGNTGKPDGARYKGRGFIQLTGRANYRRISNELGLSNSLERDPEKANDPKVAADILACFLKTAEHRIASALSRGDLREARKAVNGGSHGLTDFKRIYKLGARLLPAHS